MLTQAPGLGATLQVPAQEDAKPKQAVAASDAPSQGMGAAMVDVIVKKGAELAQELPPEDQPKAGMAHQVGLGHWRGLGRWASRARHGSAQQSHAVNRSDPARGPPVWAARG